MFVFDPQSLGLSQCNRGRSQSTSWGCYWSQGDVAVFTDLLSRHKEREYAQLIIHILEECVWVRIYDTYTPLDWQVVGLAGSVKEVSGA